jgi:hypothetical protein
MIDSFFHLCLTMFHSVSHSPSPRIIHIVGANAVGKTWLVGELLVKFLHLAPAVPIYVLDTEQKFPLHRIQANLQDLAHTTPLYLSQVSSELQLLHTLQELRKRNERGIVVIDSISAILRSALLDSQSKSDFQFYAKKQELQYFLEQIFPFLQYLTNNYLVILTHQVYYNVMAHETQAYYHEVMHILHGIWVFLTHIDAQQPTHIQADVHFMQRHDQIIQQFYSHFLFSLPSVPTYETNFEGEKLIE